MKETPTLSQIQEFFRYTCTDPRGVKDSLTNKNLPHIPQSERIRPKNLIQFITVQAPLSPESRLQVYADAYIVRILGMLESNFKLLSLTLGSQGFSKQVSLFLSKFQSKSWNIDEVAREFYHFICQKFPKTIERDIAELEWTRMEVIFAQLQKVEDLESKIHYFSDEVLSQKIVLGINSAMKFVSLSFDFSEIFEKVMTGNQDFKIQKFKRLPQSQIFACFRNQVSIQIIPISCNEKYLLEESQKGLALAQICNKLDSEGVGESAVANLGPWLKIGLISDLKLKT